MNQNREALLVLIRNGIGHSVSTLPSYINWEEVQELAQVHGLSAVVLDGIEKLPDNQRPPQNALFQWIGLAMQEEQRYAVQHESATELALLYHNNYIRTYVLKGEVVAECYPKPIHRVSSDLDCFLLSENSTFDAWGVGNDLIESKGFEVTTDYYKNSTFHLHGLTVENHKYLTPFRGNKKLRNLEIVLQSMLHQDNGEDLFDGTQLCRPPSMVSALFLIEHAYSHFLHEGLTWRHVLDWMMFREKHEKEISWAEFNAFVDEFGFRKFYDAYNRIGKYLLGEFHVLSLTSQEKSMLEDIWNPLDLHETVRGIKGKLALVGNTWRARWKYRYFSEISWVMALWIQVKGFLFLKNPTLD